MSELSGADLVPDICVLRSTLAPKFKADNAK
jgi:hypothetical protein